MAGIKISGLPSLANSESTDLFAVVQGGVTYKGTLSQILDHVQDQNIVRLSTNSNLTATYNNGSSGVGATLTNSGAMAALSIDSVACIVGDIILVRNQSTTFQNGIYSVTVVGDGSTNWVLTRVDNYDQGSEIDRGDFFTVAEGTVNAKTQWIQTSSVSTVGTDAITFESNIVAGTGISKSNNTINVISDGLQTTEVTGTSQSMSANHKYIANNGSLVTLTLPISANIGDVIVILGKGVGKWKIAQNASQTIHTNTGSSTTGVGGSVTAANQYDCCVITCITADNDYVLSSSQTAGFTVV